MGHVSWKGLTALGLFAASMAVVTCSGKARKYDSSDCDGAECAGAGGRSSGGDSAGGEGGEPSGSTGSSAGRGGSSGAAGGEGGNTGGPPPETAGEGGASGGSSVLPRPDGVACDTDEQCQSKVCQCLAIVADCGPTKKVCLEPTCEDGKTNGTESDTDCGGACIGCAVEQSCKETTDCAEGECSNDECQPPSCSDELKNGSETDSDCGGSCDADCGLSQGCFVDGDCTDGLCRDHQCVAPGCTSGSQSGSETGVDCGGPECACCATTQLEYATGTATGMFGAEIGVSGNPRAVGQGVAFQLPSALWAKSFGLDFANAFHTGDYQAKAVTLVLQVRDSRGKVLNVYEKSLDDTFVGGWVTWDITQVMQADKTYFFTAYVKDGFSNFLHNAVQADPLAGSSHSSRYTAELNQANEDLFASFSSWTPDDQWDLHFRLNGCPL